MENKIDFLNNIKRNVETKGYKIASFDFDRPWGGFLVIDESQTDEFAAEYFPEISMDTLNSFSKLSPKFLIVAPGKRLSWQYHFRRAEVWKVIENSVLVAKSDTDFQNEPEFYEIGKLIILKQGERHRLIGGENFGVVAEIWQHTDAVNPSDEEDIVRLQDDFGR